jgi:pimeloyl-ACP methyl ester carboxylesterase
VSETTMTVPTVEAQMIDVGDTPVALRRRGEGPPLLYLHGAGFTGQWLRIHEALAQGADVIAPEHPGYGGTPAPEWLEGFDDLVLHYDALRALLALDEPFDLVGQSLGGWIAAEFAVWFPEKLRSLTLIVPAGMRVPGRSAVRDLFLMNPADTVAALFKDLTNAAEVLPDPNDLDVAMRLFEEASTLARLVWERPYDPKLERRLQRVSCPTLVVGAEDDQLIPNEASDRYASLIPGARLVRIPGTGHAVAIEQPELTARAILDFQRSVSR